MFVVEYRDNNSRPIHILTFCIRLLNITLYFCKKAQFDYIRENTFFVTFKRIFLDTLMKVIERRYLRD